ncbi:MAG TPA: DUF523 domain-containing protein [Firmicutes bacterium]|nr:DUF523 domain-containing protein [Bacillota bacterium]
MTVSCYLVSACLLGINCRYDGGNNLHPQIIKLVERRIFIPVCPEQLGGLPTPRPPAEIQGGDGYLVLTGKAAVVNIEGADVTGYFIRGAEQTLKLARIYRARGAFLKARSPSCGASQIYGGGFRKQLIEGCGVTAALLKSHGLELINEPDG